MVDVLVTYDWHGGYGHPDHVQAHRVGVRAAELLGVPRRLEVTFNRDEWRRQAEEYRAANPDVAEAAEWDPDAARRRRQPARHAGGRAVAAAST